MCNTPLRLYKQYAHEGGTLTPMIAHWPRGINAHGTITCRTSHIVDLMPTVVELSGAEYPTEFANDDVLEMEGESLLSTMRGEREVRVKPIYWDFRGNHAVRDGNWKLVAERA